MIYYALVFFVISMITGFYGYRTVESGIATLSRVFFIVFTSLTALVLIFAMFGMGLFA